MRRLAAVSMVYKFWLRYRLATQALLQQSVPPAEIVAVGHVEEEARARRIMADVMEQSDTIRLVFIHPADPVDKSAYVWTGVRACPEAEAFLLLDADMAVNPTLLESAHALMADSPMQMHSGHRYTISVADAERWLAAGYSPLLFEYYRSRGRVMPGSTTVRTSERAQGRRPYGWLQAMTREFWEASGGYPGTKPDGRSAGTAIDVYFANRLYDRYADPIATHQALTAIHLGHPGHSRVGAVAADL